MKPEVVDLVVNCNCGHQWVEAKGMSVYFPFTKHVKCSKCNLDFDYKWLHPDTRQKLEEKNLGLLPESIDRSRLEILEKKIETLEARREADNKEITMLRTLLDLDIKVRIQELRSESSDHNFNMNALQTQINNLQETFDKIQEWQAKNGRQSTETGN